MSWRSGNSLKALGPSQPVRGLGTVEVRREERQKKRENRTERDLRDESLELSFVLMKQICLNVENILSDFYPLEGGDYRKILKTTLLLESVLLWALSA